MYPLAPTTATRSALDPATMEVASLMVDARGRKPVDPENIRRLRNKATMETVDGRKLENVAGFDRSCFNLLEFAESKYQVRPNTRSTDLVEKQMLDGSSIFLCKCGH
jgi:hypothetical protein